MGSQELAGFRREVRLRACQRILWRHCIRADRGPTACDRFSLPGGWGFLHDEGRLQRGPSEGSPRVCAHCPPSAIRNHVGGDAGAAPRASSDHYQLLPGFGRQRAQGLLSSVIENQGNRLAKIRQTFLARLSLPIGAWHFSAIPDIPWAVLLDDRREFVAHSPILPPEGWNRIQRTPRPRRSSASRFSR